MMLVINTGVDIRDVMAQAEIKTMLETGVLPEELVGTFTLTQPEGYTDRWILNWA